MPYLGASPNGCVSVIVVGKALSKSNALSNIKKKIYNTFFQKIKCFSWMLMVY